MPEIVWTIPAPDPKIGRPLIGEKPMTALERKRRQRGTETKQRLDDIAVLDMETDPFDSVKRSEIKPFTCCIYSDQFDPIIIWEENFDLFIEKLLRAIEGLPRAFTIYAHNGGKFDFMFFIHKLRGTVKFKGRGIMAAKIGPHELRDSFHIIPEKLANLQKDKIDYDKMLKKNRRKYRDEIIKYMVGDCRYLFEYVKAFLTQFGLKISIGQAAMYRLKQHYKVDNIGANMDAYLRRYFFGGRVECLQGRGYWKTTDRPNAPGFKLYDVNSMYPFVMATRQHPVGNEYTAQAGGPITSNTCFVELTCRNYGALLRYNDSGELSANEPDGLFYTTVHEYLMAKKLGLISHDRIRFVINCNRMSGFSDFIVPMYEGRLETKRLLKTLSEGSYEYNNAKKDDVFLKLLMNNAYGKFAQNPRKFKESAITDPGEKPEGENWGDLPKYETATHWLWERPAPGMRFNNVGTAASITGAARATLLEAIYNSTDAIYCDTDSLICRELRNTELDPVKLGAWDLEKELDEVVIAGKKLYAYRVKGAPEKEREKVKSKGAAGLSFADVLKLLDDEILTVVSKAPTMTKSGTQYYMTRQIRATVPYARKITNFQTIRRRAA